MDASKLKELKALSKETSILYVEDSVTLQKQVSIFLNNIFDNYYQAFDGQEGLEVFQDILPDIVLTDITMPNKNGLDFIKEIKKIKPDIKVIVLSAHQDHETICNSLSLGIISYLAKPLDIDKLVNILINDIKMIGQEHYTQCIQDLNTIKNHKVSLDFFNTFKGLPVTDVGSVKKQSENKIVVKVSKKQMAAMEFEKFSIIKLPVINKYIKAKVETINPTLDVAVLFDPKYINYKARNSQYNRVKVDDTFKISLHFNNKTFNAYPYDASFVSLGVVLEECETPFEVYDDMDVSIGFDLKVRDTNGSLIKIKPHKVFAKAKVIRKKPLTNGTVVVLLIETKKSDESIYLKYLNEMEKNTAVELQTLINKMST